MRLGHRRFDWLLPWVICLIGILIYHRYTILSGFDLVQADFGDSRFIAFLLEHWNDVVQGRARWQSPLIFYPVQGTLAYSDMLLGMGLPHAVLRRAGLGVFTAMNVQLILLTGLAFASCHAFLRRGFQLSLPACCAGAYFFAFGWPRFAELVHVQLQFTAPLPLMALFALQFLRDGLTLSRLHCFLILSGLAGLEALLFITTSYYALFFGLGLGVAILLCLMAPGPRLQMAAVLRRHVLPLAGATLLLVVLLIPVAQLYLPVMHASGGRQWREVNPFLPHPTDLFWMGTENYAWGWLFSRFPARALANWPGLRLGTGLAVSVFWIAAIGWATCLAWDSRGGRGAGRRGAVPATTGAAAIFILSGAILQFLMLKLPLHLTLWRIIFEVLPGFGGIRAVSRLQLVVMLPMALAIALGTEWLWDEGRHRLWLRPALAAVLLFGAAEQTGAVYLYSGRQAEALAWRVANAVPSGCRAFYVVAPAEVIPAAPPIVSEKNFDARAYLQANPDVARAWHGTAWQHYVLFGRAEHRYLDPAAAQRYDALHFFYAYTVPLAAELIGKPAVNGLSGWEPPGYDLGDSLAPDASTRLHRWLARYGLSVGSVCNLAIPLTRSDLPERGR